MKSKNIKKKQGNKVIFVSSPFAPRGMWTREENVALAKKLCKIVLGLGHIPLAPHLLFPQFLDDDKPLERDMGLMSSIALVSRCDEVWYYPKREVSFGMQKEIEKAEQEKIPCFEWKKENYPSRFETQDV